MFKNLCVMLALFVLSQAQAQKGLPSKTPTTAVVHTRYPQHVDFSDSLLAKINVPNGYQVVVAAQGLGKPRMMAMGAAGLYVTRRDQGDVLLLIDTNRDGRFDQLKTVVTNYPDVHGITIRDNIIYLCSSKLLKKGGIKPDGSVDSLVVIIKDLPDGGQHDNRSLLFGKDGLLYVTIGSDCNDCKETNPEHATVLQCSTDGSLRKIFARGLRNTIGIDWNPADGTLWGLDNGMDWRGDSLPPEELNKLVAGGDYGWPSVFGKQVVDDTREDPLGSTKEAYAKTTQPSVMEFPAHSAPIDFHFMTAANGFPSGFSGDALVCWHGSWNRDHPEGYKVQQIHFKEGIPVGVHDFFSGFLNSQDNTRFGRPAGLCLPGKGVVYISDDENGVIYLVKPKA